MDLFASAVLIAAATAPFAFAGLVFARDRRHGWVALFLGLLALDVLLTGLPVAAGLNPPGAQWNWTGKVFSLAWALAFALVGPFRAGDVGLTLRHRPGSVLPAAVVTIAVVALTGWMLGGGQRADAETLLFQASMPGLAEELVHRGVLFALLLRAFESACSASRHALLYATVVTALAFGLWHGLGIQGGAIIFDHMSFLFPFLGGLIFGWLRASTGSLLFPIVAHNGANLTVYLLP